MSTGPPIADLWGESVQTLESLQLDPGAATKRAIGTCFSQPIRKGAWVKPVSKGRSLTRSFVAAQSGYLVPLIFSSLLNLHKASLGEASLARLLCSAITSLL